MKYLSLFSGIGGFELGIQQAYEQRISNEVEQRGRGQEKSELETVMPMSISEPMLGQYPTCIGYSEIDKYAIKIYERHFPGHHNFGDITKISADALPDFDFLCGGFPCQSFSIAGKRGGFDDIRGTLFFEIARIIREKQPRLLLLENVKGLLSHDNGKTFFTIISTLDELGYDLQWQVLNSKNFGVPQNRERVFIVGHLRGTGRPEVFPFGAGNQVNPKQDAQGNDVAHTLQCGDKHRGSYIMRDGRDNRSCLRAGRTPEVGIKGLSIRRLTPTECARLQGFPDDWHKVEGISDSQAYKVYGNAVTTNVVREIMKYIYATSTHLISL